MDPGGANWFSAFNESFSNLAATSCLVKSLTLLSSSAIVCFTRNLCLVSSKSSKSSKSHLPVSISKSTCLVCLWLSRSWALFRTNCSGVRSDTERLACFALEEEPPTSEGVSILSNATSNDWRLIKTDHSKQSFNSTSGHRNALGNGAFWAVQKVGWVFIA